VTNKLDDGYRLTVGIECHVQFNTKTKLFSAVDNDAREAPPNTLVSHICFGLPGALPVLNKKAIYLATRAAFALNSSPQKFSKFDRKHYFYPDLPMGYQITQYDEPIILGGSVLINANGQNKTIGITRAHLEADAGKSVHPSGESYSLVDLNRSGTPLLEIVSEPDIKSSEEAKAYARELYLLMRYADVSDANLYYGNMRFDVNVSVSKSDELGTRTETKNINSFRSVEKVVEYEAKRQVECLSQGETIIQETRGWDDTKQKTFSQRVKENADDYRYMPDPDLPPVVLEEEFIAKTKAEMPLMPESWREKLSSLGLSDSQRETLIEAEIEDKNLSYLSLIENNLSDPSFAKFLANWFVNLEIPQNRNEEQKASLNDAKRHEIYTQVYKLASSGKLSSTNIKLLLTKLLYENEVIENIEEFAVKLNLIQVSDSSKIEEVVRSVLSANPKAVSDIKNGEDKAIGFLVGQVMKQSQGSANPGLAQEIIKKLIASD